MSKIDITKVTAIIFSPKAARFAGNWLAGAAQSRSARRRLNAILRLACRVLGAKRRKGLGMLGVAGRAVLAGVLTAFLTTGALAVDETKLGNRATASGGRSTAIGSDANAAGIAATALGNQSVASGQNANAIGSGANATAAETVAVGRGAYATAAEAVAVGRGAAANGLKSVAIGLGAKSTKASDLALGVSSAASGGNSVAIGVGAKASGMDSTAMGAGAKASGVNSTAIGDAANASGVNSAAFGYGAKASAESAIAIGRDAAGSGLGSIVVGSKTNITDDKGKILAVVAAPSASKFAIAIGAGANASGENSAAFGYEAKSTNVNALALGLSSEASGGGSIAVGSNVKAVGLRSVAIGELANASGRDSIALGVKAKGGKSNAVAIGNNAAAAAEGAIAMGRDADGSGLGSIAVGSKVDITDDKGVTTTVAAPSASKLAIAIGTGANASGENSAAFGYEAKSTNVNALALGVSSEASGGDSIALGVNAKGSKSNAVAIGAGANASGENSAAVGVLAKASAKSAIAIGVIANATDVSSVAIGYGAKAEKASDLALGLSSRASGGNSIAMGTAGKAVGLNSVAIGRYAAAVGADSLALGLNASANENNSVALGANSQTEAVHAVDGTVTLNGKDYAIDTGAESVVSVGNNDTDKSKRKKRQIINVAAGQVNDTSTDAVNGSQLNAAYDGIKRLGDSAVQYSLTKDKAGNETVDYLNVQLKGNGGTKISNVAEGTADTDAANVGQLNKVNQAAKTLGQSVANALGEGTGLDQNGNLVLPLLKPLTSLGKDASGNPVQQPTTVLGSLRAIDGVVASQSTRLDTLQQDALLYDKGLGAYSASHDNAKTNKISNVADGTADTDAVNKRQLDMVAAQANGTSGVINDSGDVISVGSDSDATTIDLGHQVETVDANGNKVTETKDRVLTGVADGSDKNDAANVGQLKKVDDKVTAVKKMADAAETKLTGLSDDTVQKSIDTAATKVGQSVADALGGDAKLVDGKVVLPEYELTSLGKDASGNPVKSTTVLGGLKAIDGVVASQGTRLGTAETDIDTLQQDALLYDKGLGAYSASRGGTKTNKISNVAEGTAATDAANVGQLNKVDQKLADLSKDTSGVIKDAGDVITIGSGSDAAKVDIGQTPKLDADGKPVLDANGNKVTETKDRVLTGIADGSDNNDAVNKGQLDKVNQAATKVGQSVADALGGDAKLVDGKVVLPEYELTSLGKDASGNPVKSTTVLGGLKAIDGVVASQGTRLDTLQQDALLYDKTLGAYSASHGTDKTRKISNVAEGTAATDAANVGQLNKVDQKIADLSNGTSGVINDSGDVISVGSGSDATTVDIGQKTPKLGADGNPVLDVDGNKVMETRDRVLTGVADGSDKNDAVNKGQLDVVDERVTAVKKTADAAETKLTGLSDDTVQESINTAATKVGQSIAEGATLDKDGNLVLPDFGLTSLGKDANGKDIAQPTTVLGGLKAIDGVVASQGTRLDTLQQDALLYDKTLGAYSASHGGTKTSRISNVADAVDYNDAVNKAQMDRILGFDVKREPFGYAIGNQAEVGWNGVAIGTDAKAGQDAVAIGAHTKATELRSVALGRHSQTEAAHAVDGTVTLNGKDYAIGTADPVGVVSIGNNDADKSKRVKRQIINVAPGQVNETSTDAVNGMQLNAAYDGINRLGDQDKRSVKYRWNDKNNNKIIDDGEIETTALMLEENQDKNGKPVGTRLGNVAGGVIDATSLEAVNGGQVHAAINSVAQSLGGGASVVNGMLSAPTFNLPSFTTDGGSSPMTFNNVGDALGQLSLNDEMFNKRFGQLKSEVDGLQQDALRWNKTIKAYDAGLGSDQSVLPPSSDAGAAGSGASSRKKRSVAAIVPTANTAPASSTSTNRITGIAEGRIAEDSTDAINGQQLKAVKDDVTNLSADVTSLSQNISQNGEKTGERLETLEDNAVVYATVNGTKTNSVQLKGGDPNAPVVVSNLGEGKQDDHAVNVKQLNKVKQHADQQLEQHRVTSKAYSDEVGEKAVNRANTYTNTKISGVNDAVAGVNERITGVDDRVGALEKTMNNGFNQLSSDIASVRKEARQAAAIGLAASSLRFDSTPGKVSVAMGGGVWRDQGAFAFGAGYTSESGKVRANITGVTSGGQIGVGAGLSFTLN